MFTFSLNSLGGVGWGFIFLATVKGADKLLSYFVLNSGSETIFATGKETDPA